MNKEEQEVLNRNNTEASYHYCFINKIASISLHEDIICKSNNIEYIYCFGRYIKQSNKEKLFRRLLVLNDLTYINLFLENIEFDKERYKDLLLFT